MPFLAQGSQQPWEEGDLPGQQVRQSRPDPEPGLQLPAPRQGEKALEQRFPAVMGTLPGQPASASYVTR